MPDAPTVEDYFDANQGVLGTRALTPDTMALLTALTQYTANGDPTTVGDGGGASAPAANEGNANLFPITASTNGTEAGAAYRPTSTEGIQIYVPSGGSITYGFGLSGVTRSTPPNTATVAGPAIIGEKLRPNSSVYVTGVSGTVQGRWI